ncbi:LysR family transcriptional regulator [Pseudomonas palleroniana]|uniref:DNA-binding transcriptional regulator, LysR family n=1 Tax=Pseudomonas palleroniana TaxID=191390 RepID=A0A1H5P6N8_9PSED|nr:LysR family transcriptional regulator [Pseudomonas palleroniana]KAB0563701.1 LysR family transcriptional regulator [Pseudomonas palleroniana]PTC22680.1 LysR family transcriptional regulator [Pseudomonas palleroniana]SEF09360.1 DNA-binding transcriptional regulator, LysR family [Pseudomonas palleroniana]
MFDWQDLYFFTVLARTQSLSAAARELQVEHATVGRRVDALEKALGVKLVDRLPRSRPLTAQGLALAKLAAGMDEMATDVMRLSRVASIEMVGTVRVSCPPSIANHCIAPHIARLRAQYPQLNLVLMPSTQVAALDKGEADIALRTVRPDENALVRRKVGVVRFGLYGSPELQQLPAPQWGFVAYDSSRDHLPQQAWMHQVRGQRPVVFAASELITQQMAARARVGAVVLPTLVGDHDPLLVRLPTASEGPVRDIWLTVYPDMRRSPSVKVVMEFLVTCIEDEPQLRR